MLRKGVYPYKYMNNLEKINKMSFTEKKIHSHLNMEEARFVCLKQYIIVS